jgi:hypothetical protein
MNWQADYTHVWAAKEGIHCVELNGKLGFIKENGIIIFPTIADDVFDFKNGKASIKINNFEFIIDKEGKVVSNKHKVIKGIFE